MKGDGAPILHPLLEEQIAEPPARVEVEIKAPPPASSNWRREIEADGDDPELLSAPCCRICLEGGGNPDELISPCMCKGTQQFVHRSCLDHWRSVKEGFAFTHCTTCKAQFHLYVNFLKDETWRTIKFRFFVAKDVLFMFLLIQMVIAALSALAYLMDIKGNFRNSFSDDWERILSKHPIPFYYCVGVVAFLVLMGICGMLLQCSSLNTGSSSYSPGSEVYGIGTCPDAPCNCCLGDSNSGQGGGHGCGACGCESCDCCSGQCGGHGCGACGCESCDCCSGQGGVNGCGNCGSVSCDCCSAGSDSSEGVIIIIVVVAIVILAIAGLIYGLFVASMVIQHIWQKHYHILTKRELTKEYVVEDLHGCYTPPKLDPKHEERLKYLKLW